MNEKSQSLEILLTHFDWSLRRMEESLKNEPSEYFQSAALERFRLTFDLAVKCLKDFARDQGTPCGSAQECFEFAEKKGLLDKESGWRNVIRDYESASQRPKGKPAEEIYSRQKNYYSFFSDFKTKLTGVL